MDLQSKKSEPVIDDSYAANYVWEPADDGKTFDEVLAEIMAKPTEPYDYDK